jgi:hypothetical protein
MSQGGKRHPHSYSPSSGLGVPISGPSRAAQMVPRNNIDEISMATAASKVIKTISKVSPVLSPVKESINSLIMLLDSIKVRHLSIHSPIELSNGKKGY